MITSILVNRIANATIFFLIEVGTRRRRAPVGNFYFS
jgi:hypothetical protein